MHARFWWGNLKGTNHFEGLGIDWKIILKMCVKDLWWEEGLDWIHLARCNEK
jgi:hypothetical protein